MNIEKNCISIATTNRVNSFLVWILREPINTEAVSIILNYFQVLLNLNFNHFAPF